MPPVPGERVGRRALPLTRSPIWIESHEQKEAARALEMHHVQLISAVIDPYSWKWVLVTLHHATQAFLVASQNEAEAGDAAESTIGRESLRVRYGDSGALRPPGVDPLPDLYAHMKIAHGYVPAPGVDEDLARLVECRETLFQRIPQSWVMRVDDLPGLTRNVLDVVDFLGWNPGRIQWRKESIADLARAKFRAAVKVLDALEVQYRL